MDLLILAGGMGSRFGGLKQIEPMHKNGEFIIDYTIYDAIKAGFDRVVFLIKKENYDIFRNTIGKRVENKIKTVYCFQGVENVPAGFKIPEGRVKPWGTAHAILCCKNEIKDNFAIVNADDFYGRDTMMKIAEALKNNKRDDVYLGIGYKVDNTLTENGAVKRGIISVDRAGNLLNVEESSIERQNGKVMATYLKGGNPFEIEPNTPVSMNVWGFTPKLFEYLDRRFVDFLNNIEDNPLKAEYLIPDIINEQVENKDVEVKILPTSSVWFGVTYKEDKDSVVDAINNMVKNGEYPDNLWE